MLSEEEFKYKYLQHPISFLTEENLDKLETHCRKVANFERGVEHKVVLELLDRYYQYQKELQDKNSKLIKLQKENKEKDNKVRKIISRLDNDYKRITETKTNKNTFPNYLDDYSRCRLKAYRTKTREIKEYIEQEYFQKLAKEKGE